MSVTSEELSINNDQDNTGGHKFVLKHVFKNVSESVMNEHYHSNEEDHFGILWDMFIQRDDAYLSVYLCCNRQRCKKEWSIVANFEVHVFHPHGFSNCEATSYCFERDEIDGFDCFMSWQDMEEEFLVNDELTVEIRVQTIKTTGIYKENSRNFDGEGCSDVTLVVNDRKFHVAKLYLSAHSSYFKSLFLSGLDKFKKSEMELSGVDADDFQKYLEALYGEEAIDEMTVEGILQLADMYDTKILVQKCEKFLLESSQKTLKKKLEMAVKYNLFELKGKCLSEIKTVQDIRSALPGCIDRMDPSLMAVFLEKTLALV
ncbi:unnamed protein product [Caenorhabditis brenneri]